MRRAMRRAWTGDFASPNTVGPLPETIATSQPPRIRSSLSR